MRGNRCPSFKILSGAAQHFWSVLKAANSVVAIYAEKAADLICRMAMIDRKSGNHAMPHHGFRPLADGAHAALGREHALIVFGADAVIVPQGSLAQERAPCFFSESASPRSNIFFTNCPQFFWRAPFSTIGKIVYSTISGIAVFKPKLASRAYSVKINPDDMAYRNAAVIADDGESMEDRRLGAHRVPMPSNLTDRDTVGVFGNRFPANGQGVIRIVFICAFNDVLRNHCGNLAALAECHNG